MKNTFIVTLAFVFVLGLLVPGVMAHPGQGNGPSEQGEKNQRATENVPDHAKANLPFAEKVDVGEGEVWNETQDEYYDTIQDAINYAEAGDKIVVGTGIYEENVVIDGEENEFDGLILTGISEEDRPEIDGSIYASEVEDITLKNFVVSNSDSEIIDGNSIYATNYTTGIIENILAENSAKDGIRVDTISVGSEITIKNSISKNNEENGITLYAPGNIINNKVENNGERGIYIVRFGGGANVVSGNEVYESQMSHGGHHSAGIEIYQYAIWDDTDGTQAIVEDNSVYNNYGNGIMLYKVNPNAVEDQESIVKGNTVYGTMNMEDDTPAGDGIMLYKSNYVTVEDNVIDNNDNAGVRVTGVYPYGVYEDSTTNNFVIDNEITNNYYGVLIQEGTKDIVVEDNEYEGNEEDEMYDY